MKELEFMSNSKSKGDTLPEYHEMEMIMKYCEVMAKAPAYASMGGMPGIFALVMTARELGIGPMTALNGGMYLIPPGIDKEGKPKGSATIMMAAKTMSMMIWRAGHKIEEVEVSDHKVTLRGIRADNEATMTVTMDMHKAKQAQLSHDSYGKAKIWSPWFKNPEDMLWKTCVAKLGRRLFTDVIGNAYEPSEFEEKEAKDKVEKPDKKSLKGKNVLEVPVISDSVKQVESLPCESLEEFVYTYKLDLNAPDRDECMIEFVKEVGAKKKLEYDDMLMYCLENKEGFLKAYELHAVQQGIQKSG
jgi:hypothetical protein